MIPWILIITGGVTAVTGVLGLLSFLYLKVKESFEVVYDADSDFLRAETDPQIRRLRKYKKKKLFQGCLFLCLMGSLTLLLGIYLGYAEEGEGFWFYKKLYPHKAAGQVWDEINEEGQFVTGNGKKYTYYILVSGKEISLRGEACADMDELRRRLSEIQRENTVILIDSFAVAGIYHAVTDLLEELGIAYEETR